jgi:hypothetical protein
MPKDKQNSKTALEKLYKEIPGSDIEYMEWVVKLAENTPPINTKELMRCYINHIKGAKEGFTQMVKAKKKDEIPETISTNKNFFVIRAAEAMIKFCKKGLTFEIIYDSFLTSIHSLSLAFGSLGKSYSPPEDSEMLSIRSQLMRLTAEFALASLSLGFSMDINRAQDFIKYFCYKELLEADQVKDAERKKDNLTKALISLVVGSIINEQNTIIGQKIEGEFLKFIKTQLTIHARNCLKESEIQSLPNLQQAQLSLMAQLMAQLISQIQIITQAVDLKSPPQDLKAQDYATIFEFLNILKLQGIPCKKVSEEDIHTFSSANNSFNAFYKQLESEDIKLITPYARIIVAKAVFEAQKKGSFKNNLNGIFGRLLEVIQKEAKKVTCRVEKGRYRENIAQKLRDFKKISSAGNTLHGSITTIESEAIREAMLQQTDKFVMDIISRIETNQAPNLIRELQDLENFGEISDHTETLARNFSGTTPVIVETLNPPSDNTPPVAEKATGNIGKDKAVENFNKVINTLEELLPLRKFVNIFALQGEVHTGHVDVDVDKTMLNLKKQYKLFLIISGAFEKWRIKLEEPDKEVAKTYEDMIFSTVAKEMFAQYYKSDEQPQQPANTILDAVVAKAGAHVWEGLTENLMGIIANEVITPKRALTTAKQVEKAYNDFLREFDKNIESFLYTICLRDHIKQVIEKSKSPEVELSDVTIYNMIESAMNIQQEAPSFDEVSKEVIQGYTTNFTRYIIKSIFNLIENTIVTDQELGSITEEILDDFGKRSAEIPELSIIFKDSAPQIKRRLFSEVLSDNLALTEGEANSEKQAQAINEFFFKILILLGVIDERIEFYEKFGQPINYTNATITKSENSNSATDPVGGEQPTAATQGEKSHAETAQTKTSSERPIRTFFIGQKRIKLFHYATEFLEQANAGLATIPLGNFLNLCITAREHLASASMPSEVEAANTKITDRALGDVKEPETPKQASPAPAAC